MLVLRGNDEVVQITVNNPGAEFTERGFTRLVNRAEGDDDLATCVGLRPTIPRHLYLKLLAKASDTVRQRLEAANPKQARRRADRGQGSDAPRAARPNRPSPSRPRLRMRWSNRCSRTAGSTNSRSRAFAEAGKFDETNASIAALANVPVAIAENMMIETRAEGVMILAKVGGPVVVDGEGDHQPARRSLRHGADRPAGLQGDL